jgi:hypothetical protein
MSALGHEQTSRHVRVMSVIPLKGDIRHCVEHVCFVPIADIGQVHFEGSLTPQTAHILSVDINSHSPIHLTPSTTCTEN